MLALERERAESAWFRRTGDLHPYLTAVIRLTAADWLLENDRPGEAAALLRWHESVQFPAWRAARADATLQARVDSARSAWPISAEPARHCGLHSRASSRSRSASGASMRWLHSDSPWAASPSVPVTAIRCPARAPARRSARPQGT